ncbi:hypothetical protein GGTG_10211 [Gaeumannomyces tritici R3-111a-1]|uniref:Uncharacterized protein n=1 Tax=Gaeumannomyces tritici (strain R3-111a-1) TaxID=644352 RepID=J3P9N4_GAET3|nr:hypothetical protein GGTG_10211 [Gaeumannomyces tritici R3-111a-1]EJT73370.1 hypothetical protein GGTG_10211 [Gaeumannomyces tritici R3-111a-1]
MSRFGIAVRDPIIYAKATRHRERQEGGAICVTGPEDWNRSTATVTKQARGNTASFRATARRSPRSVSMQGATLHRYAESEHDGSNFSTHFPWASVLSLRRGDELASQGTAIAQLLESQVHISPGLGGQPASIVNAGLGTSIQCRNPPGFGLLLQHGPPRRSEMSDLGESQNTVFHCMPDPAPALAGCGTRGRRGRWQPEGQGPRAKGATD